MGFMKSSSSKLDPSSYAARVGTPGMSTNMEVAAGDMPKSAEMPDLAEYYATERRRRERGGVAGTFTMEAVD